MFWQKIDGVVSDCQLFDSVIQVLRKKLIQYCQWSKDIFGVFFINHFSENNSFSFLLNQSPKQIYPWKKIELLADDHYTRHFRRSLNFENLAENEHCNHVIMQWSLFGQNWHAMLSILCQWHWFSVWECLSFVYYSLDFVLYVFGFVWWYLIDNWISNSLIIRACSSTRITNCRSDLFCLLHDTSHRNYTAIRNYIKFVRILIIFVTILIRVKSDVS